ncbi:CRISPR-associated Cas3 family helicase [Hydrogenothermus marinus]|uniref:CRISPR-associated Cas3 family helicase n=1 Tax=Hydrogenothermus marinus TaxID=133270 RepID=A0A3M0BKM6_9AQUI|nr:CRISPR-associated Cas3 family helicase [Hydrogenothermus marinus]
MNEVYAKIYFQEGKPIPETLKEHTENLLNELKRLRKLYEKDINTDEKFWESLKLACLFHDIGKISSLFQNKIKKILKEKQEIPKDLKKEIPHNYLSGIVFYSDDIKKLLKELGLKDYRKSIFYAVVFHHDRNIDFTEDYLKEVLEKDISKKIGFLNWLKNYGIKIENINVEKADILFSKITEYKNNSNSKVKDLKKDKFFILLKGLLHRIDHSASAHLPVEEERIYNVEQNLHFFIKNKKNSTLKPFQEKAKDLRDKNVLLTASTGMGKTEFAINWIGDNKAFYTLPVRVSVNAMYERFKEVFEEDKEKIGLLHSDSIFYGLKSLEKEEKDLEIEEHIIRTQTTRQFSMPITISTADQLFTSVLKYPGFEKIYATLSYSKIVLDEPQSYSPDTLAIIIKGLQEISKLGGKFCLMSATIHPFIKEYLKDIDNLIQLEAVFDKRKKHKIKLLDTSIDDEKILNKILDLYNEGKKVLIISNTVKKSQEIYKRLKEISMDNANIKLLHSLFIKKDRAEKEKQIKADFEKDQPVIWITTQLVEASLDIDYDVLFTEIATLDSLIQRIGRIYRKEGRTITEEDKPNIYILTENPSDKGKIYNKDIVNLTKDALQKYNEKILSDEEKQNLIEEVFDIKKIKDTNFYKTFEKNLKLLEYGYESESKSEAQRIFREILNVDVIPEKVYQENLDLIENLIEKILDKSTNKIEKLLNIQKLNSFTLSVPFFRIKEKPTLITSSKIRQKIFSVNIDYDNELGLRIDKEKAELGEIL